MNQKRLVAWVGLVASVLTLLSGLWINVEAVRGILADIDDQGWRTTFFSVMVGLMMTASPVICLLFINLIRLNSGEK